MRAEPLTTEDLALLNSDREFVPAVLEEYHPQQSLRGTREDLPILQLVLDGGPYSDDPEGELVALGATLGDLLALELGMSWVRVSDDEGEELALKFEDTSIVAFPRDMIIKRVERGEEEIDLTFMFAELAREIRHMISSGMVL
jgi:hypothetical protein